MASSSGPKVCQHADGRHALGAVYEGEPFLGFEHERLQAAATEGGGGRHALAFEAHLAFADHGQREVRERRQVARGTERALLGHDRQQPVPEHVDKALHHLAPHPGVAESEHVGPQGQHRPDLVGRQLVADGDGVGAQEAVLQGPRVLRGEVHVRQAAETGRHPVDDLTRLEGRDDDPARAVDTLQDLLAEARRGSPGDGDDLFDSQRAAQRDLVRRHEPSIAALRSRGP